MFVSRFTCRCRFFSCLLSGNMVKTNCLQLNIMVKQTPAQGALGENHLRAAVLNGTQAEQSRALQESSRGRSWAKPFAWNFTFVASASNSPHNLLWFCIYFASQACLRLSPAAPGSISSGLLLGCSHLPANQLCQLPASLSSKASKACLLPGTSVSDCRSPFPALDKRSRAARLLVLVLCAAFAPCLQSLQRLGRPCGNSDPKLQLSSEQRNRSCISSCSCNPCSAFSSSFLWLSCIECCLFFKLFGICTNICAYLICNCFSWLQICML